jgi:hemoglobin
VNRVTEKENQIPSLYKWLGGAEVQNASMVKFYERVSADELLRPLFGGMPADHPRHVADFGRGAGRIASLHRERRRWVNLLLDSADEIGLPGDPEFRSALVAYLEWGSRLAVMNSKLPAETVADPATPMPHWSWGVPGGPYEPEQE